MSSWKTFSNEGILWRYNNIAILTVLGIDSDFSNLLLAIEIPSNFFSQINSYTEPQIHKLLSSEAATLELIWKALVYHSNFSYTFEIHNEIEYMFSAKLHRK